MEFRRRRRISGGEGRGKEGCEIRGGTQNI
jgi:hypothetical protein